MEQALIEWDAKEKKDKTWKHCKDYFSRKYADCRKHKSVDAKQAGFVSANQAKESNSQDLVDCADELKEVLPQLTSSDSNELKKIIERKETC